jgi:hypothetical protein
MSLKAPIGVHFGATVIASCMRRPFAVWPTKPRSSFPRRATIIARALPTPSKSPRSPARWPAIFALDTDLTEALALAHDLGHTPFGHTGEDALASVMHALWGFEHNAQTLRIVTKLEQRYAGL